MSQVFRLFEPITTFEKNSTLVFSDDSHHIVSRVLRLVSGDTLELLNGSGQIATVVITDVAKKNFSAEIESVKTYQRPSPKVRLYVATLKGEKLSMLCQKVTELGVDEINFFLSDHSVAQKSEELPEKITKTLIEALRQSGNPFLPTARFLKKISDMQIIADSDHWNLVLDEKEKSGFSAWRDRKKPTEVSLFVGPEGGFSESEREFFKNVGCHSLTIAPYVLRAETAAISAVALVRGIFS